MTAQSQNVVDFQLHTLGWKAFQDLSVTIMTDIFGHDVQSFYDSNDGGRDGAYHGVWNVQPSHSKSGTFTVQCKFTSVYKKGISVGDLKDDIEKARRLAAKGLADHYILFTNAQLTGKQDELLRAKFESIDGIKTFAAYGKERISQIIQESARLRMLVPRIYGLGDLSQILDVRALDQAKSILSSLGDDIAKFVLTEAYQRSAKALVKHGFVLLLGEPACGKSTIAASLALGALDEWSCDTIKVCSSAEFVQHWNPNEPNRLFWVDDAFGATQVDWSATWAWAKAFPHVNAAIKQGAKVIFTSRDYIYHSAKGDLKESSLPVLKASQVVINVQEISDQEKQQILYNHIKLGNQSLEFKRNIKPFLKDVAGNKKFTPEIARRLGDKFFTQSLQVNRQSVLNFVEKPIHFLVDVLSSLNKPNICALAIIFMRAGKLVSPVTLVDSERNALELIGGRLSDVIDALKHLNGSLTNLSFEDEGHVWRYKHPTIRDAFAQYLADNIELLEIYLSGAPLETLFQEVVCPDIEIEGAKIIIPETYFSLLTKRMHSFKRDSWHSRNQFNNFLTKRSNEQFLSYFLDSTPNLFDTLRVESSFFLSSEIEVFIKFFELKLLPEVARQKVFHSLRDASIYSYDTLFMDESVSQLLTIEELDIIVHAVKKQVIDDIGTIIDDISSTYEGDVDPEDLFLDLTSAINEYETFFVEDADICTQLAKAKDWIQTEIKDLTESRGVNQDFEHESVYHQTREHISERSIFDDVDS